MPNAQRATLNIEKSETARRGIKLPINPECFTSCFPDEEDKREGFLFFFSLVQPSALLKVLALLSQYFPMCQTRSQIALTARCASRRFAALPQDS
jgi:hypothetical protein